MFILMMTIGEYSDETTHVVIASENVDKLNQRRDSEIAKNKVYHEFESECEKEFDRLIALKPFTEKEPQNRLPRPDKPPQTKEEHEARKKLKDSIEAEHDLWYGRNRNHTDAIELEAKNNILPKYVGVDFESVLGWGRENLREDNFYTVECEVI